MVLLLFNSETGESQRAANGETEAHAPAKTEKAAPVAQKAEAPKEEAKAEAPVAEAKAPATEEKAEAPAKEAKADAPAVEEKAEAPAKETKAEAPVATAPNLGACKGCHGANFEKVAMGKSKVVSEMSKADITTALKGYKDGSYGGAMKGLMKGQVASFDDTAIDAIAGAIGK
jgi:cytochrome c553